VGGVARRVWVCWAGAVRLRHRAAISPAKIFATGFRWCIWSPFLAGFGGTPTPGDFAQIHQTKRFRSGPWLQNPDSKGGFLQILPKMGLSCGFAAKAGLDFGLSPCVYYMRGVKGFGIPGGENRNGDKGGIRAGFILRGF
jgi:hypothetical protein